MKNHPSVRIYTLGCKVNQQESESMYSGFASRGVRRAKSGDVADLCIVNTCTVTSAADSKSRQYIRRAARENPGAMIVVTGCYPNVETELRTMIPEIDHIVSGGEKDRLVEIVSNEFFGRRPHGAHPASETEVRREQVDFAQSSRIHHVHSAGETEDRGEGETARTLRAGRTRAFLKIQDGCDRYCSYCIIPMARGGVRSEEKNELLKEFRRLLSLGYKEIVLTGINIALFSDGKGEASGAALVSLLKEMIAEPGDFRLRLGSLEPNVLDPAAIEEIAELPKLCPDYHISLQSGSDRTLASMGRNYSVADFADTVKRLRSIEPLVSISTDIIAGFPGETSDDHLASLRAVEETKFSKVHVFKFSRRKGTRAFDLPSQIDEGLKAQRSRELALAAGISAGDFLKSNIGKTRRALILNRDGDKKFRALTDNGIDIRLENSHIENTFADVRLTPGMMGM